MLHSNVFVNKNLHLAQTLLRSPCFSAQSLNYVKKAKTLEGFKSNSSLPDQAFHQGRYMLLIKSDLVCTEAKNKLIWKHFQDIKSLANNLTTVKILLDLTSDKNADICLFAIDFNIETDQDIKDLELKIGGKFINARESLLNLNKKDCQYVAQAKGLSHFNRTFNFCPNCGNDLIRNAIGTHKHCRKCQQIHYPYVAPVGIVLLEDVNHKKVLLVRQGRHPPGMYSCVAGFIEPGETLHEAIEREVAEEVGLMLNKVEFCSSQHWAMPSSQLMLACIGTVANENFELDGKEIEKAMWVTADSLRDALSRVITRSTAPVNEENDLWVPPAFTASHQLMQEWLRKHHSLRQTNFS